MSLFLRRRYFLHVKKNFNKTFFVFPRFSSASHIIIIVFGHQSYQHTMFYLSQTRTSNTNVIHLQQALSKNRGEGKSKVHRRTGHEGPEEEYYSFFNLGAIFFLPASQEFFCVLLRPNVSLRFWQQPFTTLFPAPDQSNPRIKLFFEYPF